MVGIDKFAGSIAKSDINNIVTKVTPCMKLKKTTKSARTHACNFSQLR